MPLIHIPLEDGEKVLAVVVLIEKGKDDDVSLSCIPGKDVLLSPEVLLMEMVESAALVLGGLADGSKNANMRLLYERRDR
jgi:hypothetical protein